MITPDGQSIGLAARPPYADVFTSHGASHISSSVPLLDEDLSNSINPGKFKWEAKSSSESLTGLGRRSSGANSDTGKKMLPGRRKRSRLCLKLGGAFLLLLFVNSRLFEFHRR
jgi:hypothetical protein